MAYTLYDATIPAFVNGLNTMLILLTKAEAYAADKGVDISTLLQARLAEDMHPLTFQYYVATETAMKTVTRIQGIEPEVYENNLKVASDLRARVEHTIAIVKAADKSVFEARPDVIVPLPIDILKEPLQMKARDYVGAYGIPNFYFHVQTAYCILRAQGVPLSKADFLGSSMGPFFEQHHKQQRR
ncbi:hypothetical protein EsH8_III_001548 [Colletotrichum jinshuiense]